MDEDEFIALSALQHMLYCPRQCALIHVEQVWAENRATVEGQLLHARTDEPGSEIRRGVKVETAMPVRSMTLGVAGVLDAVELREAGGVVVPYPVEYKRGRPKPHRADEVQLAAQAMALEEMFGTAVRQGALFYGETRRRTIIAVDAELRRLTVETAAAARALIAGGIVPHAAYEARRCRACSLLEHCRPRQTADGGRVAGWLARQIAEAEA